MDWRDDVAAEMPPPNEDEPASLRRDILDELSDHLACAAQRERIHEPDENTVRQTILNRFGNPAQIARRLWFDAMKGKIMLQKLTAAFAATAALAAIVVCLVLWSAVNGVTAAFELAVADSRADRDRADKANAAMLAKLETMAADAKTNNAATLEWNPLKIKLVLGEEGDRPAPKYFVTLEGQPYLGGEKTSIYKRAGMNGIVDFGRVRPGNYDLVVRTPWKSEHRDAVHVAPGSDVEKTIRCPDTRIVEADVELTVELPADLAKRKCRVVTRISGPSQRFGLQRWSMPWDHRSLHCELAPSEPIRFLDSWQPSEQSNEDFDFLANIYPKSHFGGFRENNVSAPQWKTGEYSIKFIALLLPNEKHNLQKQPSRRNLRQYGREHLPESFVVTAISYGDGHPTVRRGLKEERHPTFTPLAGKKNVWKITLPAKLLADARKRLDTKAKPQPREKKFRQPGESAPAKNQAAAHRID